MELKDLAGTGILTGCDYSEESIRNLCGRLENCSVFRFCLNGVVYIAVEDPDDGYRSSMKELAEGDGVALKNTFEGVHVDCVYQDKTTGYYSQECDILRLVDAETGEVVLEVGTDRTDDYYPSFVGSFNPEAMVINQC